MIWGQVLACLHHQQRWLKDGSHVLSYGLSRLDAYCLVGTVGIVVCMDAGVQVGCWTMFAVVSHLCNGGEWLVWWSMHHDVD